MKHEEHARRLREELGVGRVTVRLADPVSDDYPVQAEALAPDVPSLMGQPVVRSVAEPGPLEVLEQTLQPVVQEDVTISFPRFPQLVGTYGVRAQVLAPILRGGRMVGLVSAHDFSTRAWSQAEVAAVQRVASDVADELDKDDSQPWAHHAVAGPRRDLVGYGSRVPKVRWPNDAHVALNLVVNYEEGSEYSFPAGDARNEGQGEFAYSMGDEFRDLGVESAYEYGSRAGIWRLLRLFDEYHVKATFFAAAVALEANPEVGRWIQRAGHEPCSHGWRWSEPWLFASRDEEREHIRRAVASIERTCGERPRGWFCRYSASPHTRELLVEEGGFVYDADAYNDDLPYFTEVLGRRHLVVPYTFVYNDGRIIALGYGSPSDFVDYCVHGLDELRREGAAGFPKMMSIGLHPRWMGQAARASALRQVIEHAQSANDVWITRRLDIAEWWLAHHEEFQT